jgi:hypothetical protein
MCDSPNKSYISLAFNQQLLNYISAGQFTQFPNILDNLTFRLPRTQPGVSLASLGVAFSLYLSLSPLLHKLVSVLYLLRSIPPSLPSRLQVTAWTGLLCSSPPITLLQISIIADI